MSLRFKSPQEISSIHPACQLAVHIVDVLRRAVSPGVTTRQLDHLAANQITAAGARSCYLNHPTFRPGEGYPSAACISVNEEVTHALPNDRPLDPGDIITLDVGLELHGFCGSRAITVGIPPLAPPVAKLIQVVDETLDWAIANIHPHRNWSDVARLMQSHVESNGFGVVREFIGHGIGRQMIEDPGVPAFATSDMVRKDFRLRPGMVLTIETMITLGRRNVVLLDDQWTVATEDRSAAAHARHVVAITDEAASILTADPSTI
jgi:methionyl aminopeptidase